MDARRGPEFGPPCYENNVQGFFAHLLERKTLSRADQEKGRLRTFLLTPLQNFVMDERDRSRTIKRGGGQQILSFDEYQLETEAAMLATAHLDDVSCYDLVWASNIARRLGSICSSHLRLITKEFCKLK
jgi:hypothetical protein